MEKAMKAKLLSYSQAADGEFGELSDIQDLVAYCARVSNPSNQMNTQTSEKLLNYLAKHKHWSPFEMVSVCLEVETTRDIARQLLRHRSFSFQEFSQRYANPLEDLEYETREARLQDEKNRQNSVEVDDQELQDEWLWQQEQVITASRRAYSWAINNGIAKEQARAVLPEGLMVSRLYVNGTLRSWMHYIDLRSANGTQKEHIELAQEIARAIHLIYPTIDKYVNS
jgi:thymidylate synthase (FAD)